MITSPEEYMRRLSYIQLNSGATEYVLFPEDEPRFVINANTRQIEIPPEFTFLGVRGDHNAETIYFEIDRYFDGHDLSRETCVVQFESLDKNNIEINEGFFAVTQLDVSTAPGKIIFGWSIRNNVTAQAGSVRFSVRFYSIDPSTSVSTFFLYSFNTLPASLPILESLNTIEDIKPIKPSEVEKLTIMFSNIKESAEKSAEEAKASSSTAATFAAQAEKAKEYVEQFSSELAPEMDKLLKLVLPKITVIVEAGSNVTLVNGSTIHNVVVPSAGRVTQPVYSLGQWTVTATKGGKTATQTVSVAVLGNTYEASLQYPA